MPRSMVSLGMLLAFALAMTSRSLLLLAGSGPPSFTATTISRPIIVKIFPFLASFFSFLCFMFANFECPDMFFTSSCCNFPIKIYHHPHHSSIRLLCRKFQTDAQRLIDLFEQFAVQMTDLILQPLFVDGPQLLQQYDGILHDRIRGRVDFNMGWQFRLVHL